MSVLAPSGHTRVGARSADVVDARLVATDNFQTALLDAPSATLNFLTVTTAATFAGTATFTGALAANAPASFAGPVTIAADATVATGHAVAVDSATTFDANVVVASPHTLTVGGVDVTAASGTLAVAGRLSGGDTTAGDVSAATISGTPTLTAGATIASGEALGMAGATFVSSGVVFSDGLAIAAGQTLLCGSGVLTNWVFANGFVMEPGTTLTMSSASFAGLFTASDGLTVSPGQNLGLTGASIAGGCTLAGGATAAGTTTLTGATLAGGGTGALTGLFTLNGIRATVFTKRAFGAPTPIPAGLVFPTLRPPAAATGMYVLDATSFAGEASNGTNTGGVRGSTLNNTGARATAVDITDANVQDFTVFNRSPYTFFLLNNTFQNQGEMSSVPFAWYPLTALRCSRAAQPVPGPSTLWKATAQPLRYVSGWASLDPALLTSADCTLDLYRHQYSVVGGAPGNNRLGVRVSGQLLIHFTTAAPTDPVRIAVPLPVGAVAETAYPAVAGFTPRCGVFRDWVVSATSMFPESATAFVGDGELARDLGTYARTDATARVAAYVENGDPSANLLRVVVSEFTGGAGSYKLRVNYSVPMENLVYRATYNTFSYVV